MAYFDLFVKLVCNTFQRKKCTFPLTTILYSTRCITCPCGQLTVCHSLNARSTASNVVHPVFTLLSGHRQASWAQWCTSTVASQDLLVGFKSTERWFLPGDLRPHLPGLGARPRKVECRSIGVCSYLDMCSASSKTFQDGCGAGGGGNFSATKALRSLDLEFYFLNCACWTFLQHIRFMICQADFRLFF